MTNQNNENQNFQLGFLVTTLSVNEEIKKNEQFNEFCKSSLNRHKNKDWGDLGDEDKVLNDESLLNEGRLFSSYKITEDLKDVQYSDKIWIITEWDRSCTTILFPCEY